VNRAHHRHPGDTVAVVYVESALLDLPGLTAVAALGRPDPRWDQSVVFDEVAIRGLRGGF
jgi:hypothetical protein